jgi:uncharacterized protein (UPF0333 family)
MRNNEIYATEKISLESNKENKIQKKPLNICSIYVILFLLLQLLLIAWAIISYFLIKKKNSSLEVLKEKIDLYKYNNNHIQLRANEDKSNDNNNTIKNRYNNPIVNINWEKECIIGDNEKCKTCSHQIKSNCLTCNDGYYLPFHKMYNQKCLPCNKTVHCNACFGEKNYIVCTACEPEYILVNNTCLLEFCLIGENEKCKSCNSELKNQCQLCNDGYYLPTDGNKEICQKCLIDNCDLCSGTLTNQICLKCKEDFINENNKCEKQEITPTEQVCPDEYFVPEDSTNCQKCSLKNCKI